MEITINVINQKLRIETNQRNFVAGSQQFVKFIFRLTDDWTGLSPFAQFVQNGTGYNTYLDTTDWSCYLPSEIEAGECTLMLYGSDGTVIGTTNVLTLTIDENHLLANAESTEISQSLYDQLIAQVAPYSEHISDTTVHITAAERTAWNAKAPANHASTATTYGIGTGSNYGHVKLSDSTSSTSSTGAGIAATPAAVKAAYDHADGAYNLADSKQEVVQKGTISLSTTWTGSDPYTQSVSVSGATVTSNSLVALQLTDAQLDQLEADGVSSLRVDNNNGTLSISARGGVTAASMSVQCTVMEVS